MRRLSLVLALAVIAACTAAFSYGHGQADAFRLPDASAACRLDGARLVCADLGLHAGVALAARGAPHAAAGRVWWDAGTPVLSSWTRDGIRCRREERSIACSNAAGASISVGAARIEVSS